VLLTQKKAPGARPDRFPLIVEAVNHLKIRSCLIDGEAVCCDGDGLASFTPLRGRRDDARVFLYAFDLIELDGEDMRRTPVGGPLGGAGKAPAQVPAGPEDERAPGRARRRGLPARLVMGLEGIVSKRIGSRYRSGRSPDWLKSKNPSAPAVRRDNAGHAAPAPPISAINSRRHASSFRAAAQHRTGSSAPAAGPNLFVHVRAYQQAGPPELRARRTVKRCQLQRAAVHALAAVGQQRHWYYSISSSARTNSIGEISRPSALAVRRLMISSSLVGNSMGRSETGVPRSIL
jgi:hypothetical protein